MSKPEEVHEAAVDPSIGLGEIWKYSQLIGMVIASIQAAGSVPVGGETDLPMFKTWLPDGHQWELTIHGKKTR